MSKPEEQERQKLEAARGLAKSAAAVHTGVAWDDGFERGWKAGRADAPQLSELLQKIEFHGYGDDPLKLNCGHGRWSSKGDCVTCLSFCIDELNRKNAELSGTATRMPRLKVESDAPRPATPQTDQCPPEECPTCGATKADAGNVSPCSDACVAAPDKECNET